jgi:hypothetical protein
MCLQLAAILVTHHHADHVGGIDALRPRLQGPCLWSRTRSDPAALHAAERRRQSSTCWVCSFDVIDVPGHTAGHIAYAQHGAPSHALLFCGDTLFSAGCGRLFEGTPAQMHDIAVAHWPRCPPTPGCAARTGTRCPNLRFAAAVEADNPAVHGPCVSRDKPTLPRRWPNGRSTRSCAAAKRLSSQRLAPRAQQRRNRSTCWPPCLNGRTASDEPLLRHRRWPACWLCLCSLFTGCATVAPPVEAPAPVPVVVAPPAAAPTRCPPRRPPTSVETAGGAASQTAGSRVRLDPLDDASRGDLWERVRQGFAMTDLDSDLVRKWEQYYAQRPDYVQRMTAAARATCSTSSRNSNAARCPPTWRCLPFIESAFDPQALSVARAAGMWQFMPGTGRDFELKQNLFRDDRRDILASTRAALDYLQRLHGMFNDWHLALAAYNWGQGNVQKALARNAKTGHHQDYSSLRMPEETRNYVPKLQAIKNIVARPDAFALVLPPLENHPYFISVPIERDIDVVLAARLSGLTLEQFQQLNPQLNKPVILAAGTPQVLLPYDNANLFVSGLATHRGTLASWTAWVARARSSRWTRRATWA